jgi:probable HAF family extracellular repeat protein
MIRNPTVLLTAAALSLIMSALTGQTANVQIQANKFVPTYKVTVLSQIPGVNIQLPTGIFTTQLLTGFNQRDDYIGTVLGDAYDNAILIRKGKLIDIAPVVGNSYASAINDSGLVVGTYWDLPTQRFLAFAYNKQGTFSTFTPATDALETDGISVNDLGQVAGFFSPAGFERNSHDHVFIRQVDGTFTDLGDFGTDPYALINNQGRVLITSDIITPGVPTYTEKIDTYISRPGSHSFEHLPGFSTQGSAMNDIGEVIGTTDTLSATPHAYVYYNGHFKDLGVLPGYTSSSGDSINNLGQTVGSMYGTQGQVAWVNLDGTIRILNTLLRAKDKGWVILNGIINDKGEILATGILNGVQVSYNVLLTPTAVMRSMAAP